MTDTRSIQQAIAMAQLRLNLLRSSRSYSKDAEVKIKREISQLQFQFEQATFL